MYAASGEIFPNDENKARDGEHTAREAGGVVSIG
jgi:hypothetical protein